MTKRRKEPHIGKTTRDTSRVPVLKDKVATPKLIKKPRYRGASLSTFHTGERAIANAENKTKRVGVDARTKSGAGSPSTKFLSGLLRGWKGGR